MRPINARSIAPIALVLALSPALAGCGGDDALGGSSASGSSGSGNGKSLVVGGADFTEMKIMEQMYKGLLEKAGYTVTLKTASQREIYAPSLEKGEIDVVPEYAATMAEYLNKAKNGAKAPAIATNDAATTVEAMKPLAETKGLTVLEPSKAADQNGFYVTKKFSDAKKVTTLSEMAKQKLAITLAAGDDCKTRPFCAPGLKKTYGLNIKGVTGDTFGSATGKQKVVNGTAQMGLTGTTDGTLDGLGLVVLKDDKKLQAADNLVPIVNTKDAGDPAIAEALDKLAGVLTTEDLQTLNGKVDGQRQKPDVVAEAYLKEKGLL